MCWVAWVIAAPVGLLSLYVLWLLRFDIWYRFRRRFFHRMH